MPQSSGIGMAIALMTIGVYKRTSSTFHLRNRNEPGNADIVVQLPL
jgi:hypothetical protein